MVGGEGGAHGGEAWEEARERAMGLWGRRCSVLCRAKARRGVGLCLLGWGRGLGKGEEGRREGVGVREAEGLGDCGSLGWMRRWDGSEAHTVRRAGRGRRLRLPGKVEREGIEDMDGMVRRCPVDVEGGS